MAIDLKQRRQRRDQLERIQVLSELVARATFAAHLGLQYGGERDVYDALGYKKELTYADYFAHYDRQDIAAAVIDKPVDATWHGGFRLEESSEPEDTPLEKEWKRLSRNKNLLIFDKFARLDKLAGIGRYAVLFLGLSDAKTRADLANPVESSNVQLLYCRPLSEISVEMHTKETNPSSPRYGQPILYKLTFDDDTTFGDITVHYTRVIHVPGNLLEGSLVGESRLKPIMNRLYDLEKLVGGSAEMFWRGARPGYAGSVRDDYELTEADERELEDQLDEYENYLRRFLVLRGIDLQAMDTQIADPSSHVDVQLQMISAATGIPKRILVGSERGELASSQDQETWYSLIEARRQGYVEHRIVRPFVDRLIELGVLPQPQDEEEGYAVVWNEPMHQQSTADKVEIGKARAAALKDYASEPMAEGIVPPDAFYRFFLGLDTDEIKAIEAAQEAAMADESTTAPTGAEGQLEG